MNSISKLKYLAFACLLCTGCSENSKQKELDAKTENNEPLSIIFMIGDGMGLPQITTAFYFGEDTPNFQQFQHIGLIKTSSTSHEVTDSAAGATAFSTGEKTYNRAIGVSKDSMPQETILEQLQQKGYQTGLISLTSITHATPAAFYAHVVDRDMHEDIAEQFTNTKIDFVAGGGRQFFNKRADGKNLFAKLLDNNYYLDTLQLSKTVSNKPHAYILADDGLPAIIEGRKDFLNEATSMALNYFDEKKKPFFMMIEGSFIDWGGHAENADMLITEVADFNRTLGTVLKYVENHPNTLLIVTADHETGGVSVGKFYETNKSTGEKKEIPKKVAVYFNSNQHTAELIPVFAKGKGAELFQGIYENNMIYNKILEALNNK